MSLHGKFSPARMVILSAATMLAVVFSGGSPASAGPAKPAPQAADSAAVVAESAPVTTLAAPPGCPASYLCFWAAANYVDGPGKLSGSNTSWFDFGHSSCPNGTWADCVSSIYNNGVNCTAHVYYYEDYVWPRLDIVRNDYRTNLAYSYTPEGWSWNDNIRSNNWC